MQEAHLSPSLSHIENLFPLNRLPVLSSLSVLDLASFGQNQLSQLIHRVPLLKSLR